MLKNNLLCALILTKKCLKVQNKLLNNEFIEDNKEIKIDFNIKNPISPLEILESPDSRKLGILLKSIELKST